MNKSEKKPTPETRLAQFSACFKNEADLRLSLIALLERLPNTSRVRHTHGTDERGKDILFNVVGAFATEETIACVVKNSPITGSVGSDDGARTVYHQAEQCLDTPFLNSKGEERYAARVFIITPYECNQSAIDSIKGKLSKPDAAVKFLCGRELYELFDKYYPEYLVFRSGMFGSYITDLENGITRDSAVANLLMKHGLSGTNHEIARIYVQPTLEIKIFRYYLLTEWPKFESLPQPSLEVQVETFARGIVTSGQFLATIAPPEEANNYPEKMNSFASSLRGIWKADFADYRKTRSPLEMSENAERKRVALQLSQLNNLAADFRAQTTAAKALFDGFNEKLEKANELAEAKPATLDDFLAHPNHHDYSYVRNIAAQIPAFFEESVMVSSVIRTSGEALVASGQDMLLTAPAGFGKSSFCRWNVLHDLRDLKEGRSNVVPVLIPLHQLDGELPATVTALFGNTASLLELWSTRRSPDGGTVNRRFRLYLDGLDEVPDANRQRVLCNSASGLKMLEPLTQLIFTGREHIGGAHLVSLSRLHVAEMNERQIDELIERWFGDRNKEATLFRKQIALIPSMTDVMRVPLLATLVLSVYESTATLPESKIKLYDMFISLMAGGWDAAKKIHRDSKFGSQPKTTVLQYLAGRLHLRERREATASDVRNAVRIQLPALEQQCDLLLEEIVQDGLLVRIGNSYEFSHLSFQEYLAAKDLVEPRGRRAAEAIVRYLRGNPWWNEVLFFYVALSGQPKEIETFIREQSLRCARTYSEPQMLKRAQTLLTQLQRAFPGAQVDFRFPQWPKTAR